MYANSRAVARPKATFRTAGGTQYIFQHPFLAGAIGRSAWSSEVNVSASMKLNDTFFNAKPLMDSAQMEVMVDGSAITITNNLMAGIADLQVVPQDGTVAGGDLIAIAHFIIASRDDVGGALRRIREVNGRKITRVYYGVSFKNVPHDVDAGNSVPVYPVQMQYAGWFEGIMGGSAVQKTLWAVGNRYGIKGGFESLSFGDVSINEREGGENNEGKYFLDSPKRYSKYDAISGDMVGFPANPDAGYVKVDDLNNNKPDGLKDDVTQVFDSSDDQWPPQA
jgi:hypothetical protein